jgi:hypothetical protein
MARKTVLVSDLSGREIGDEATRLRSLSSTQMPAKVRLFLMYSHRK